MKLNAYKDHISAYYEVYLDGVKLDHCFEADEEAGYVLVHEIDENGQTKVENGNLVVKRLEGKVGLRTIIGLTVGLTEDTETNIRGRDAFIKKYCAEKGWNREQLDIDQIMEIRSQDGWENLQDRL